MYTRIGHVELRSGELVEAGVVQAPDTEWAPRIGPMLQHKGTPWIWQIANLLTRELGIDVHFYVLHREGRPLANVMTVDRLGVGIFGHVWTQPDDRRQGASSQLVRLQLDHFRQRHGRALYLGTDYDSFAYHLYRSFGFEGIESRSDYMAYVPEGSKLFDTAWFAAGPVAVEALDWSHWPLLQPLALGRSPGLVRNAAMQIYGRQIFEGGPLPFIRRNAERQARGQTPVAQVLVNAETQAVVGLASWADHPLWQETILFDLFCHADYWAHAPTLVDSLALPDARLVAYVAAPDLAQRRAYTDLGFRQLAVLPGWLQIDAAKTGRVDVLVLDRALSGKRG